MEDRKDYVYVLKDPTTNEVRYVGHTFSPKERLKGHRHNVKAEEKNPHFINWWKKLEREDKEPILEVIEECVNTDKALERERYLELEYRAKGCRLLNSIPCGTPAPILFGKDNPFYGKKHTKETQEQIRQKRLGMPIPHTKEWDEKIGKSLGGKKKSFEHRFNLLRDKLLKKEKGFMGVHFHKHQKKWTSSISDIKNNKRVSIGYFKNKTDCAKAFDKKCWELYHDKSILNFPEDYK
jgi:predicted GIY-YIG superfamily endonuclease